MSFELNVTSPELDALALRLKFAPTRLWTRAMSVFLERVTAQLQAGWARKLGKHPFPHFTGAAASSIQRSHRVQHNGTVLNFQGKVFSPLTHVGVLEGGRKPGTFPALDALTRWVQLRATRGDIKVDVEDLAAKRKRTDKGLVTRKPIERRLLAYRTLAYLIGVSIRDRGQPPKRFARKTLRSNRKKITKEVTIMARELARAITRRGGGGGS